MEIKNIFYYPVGLEQTAYDDSFYSELIDKIEKEEQGSKGVKISNYGGWQSSKEFFEEKTGVIAEFKNETKKRFLQFLKEVYKYDGFEEQDLEMVAWANVNYKGNSNNSHDHSADDNHWSGIFYVQTGNINDSQPSGLTVFENRNLSGDGRMISSVPAHKNNPGPISVEIKITPRKGQFVFFPGSLWHRVEPFQGESKRITIAFNFKVNHLENSLFDQTSNKERFMSYMWVNFRWFMAQGSRIKRLFL